jgi:hypothetical protein
MRDEMLRLAFRLRLCLIPQAAPSSSRGGADELEDNAVVLAEGLLDAAEERRVLKSLTSSTSLTNFTMPQVALVPHLLVLPCQPVCDPMPEHGHSLASRSLLIRDRERAMGGAERGGWWMAWW